MIKNRQYFIQFILLVLDVISIVISLGIAFWIRYKRLLSMNTSGDSTWFISYVLILYMSLCLFMNFNKNFFEREYFEEFKSILKANGLLGITLVTLLFITHSSADVSRLVFGYFLIANCVLQYVIRLLFKFYMITVYRRSRASSRMLLVTSEGCAEKVISDLQAHKDWYRQIIGIILQDHDECPDGSLVLGIPIVCDVKQLVNYCTENPVDEVFVIDTESRISAEVLADVNSLVKMGVIVHLNISEFDVTNFGNKALTHVGHYDVVSFARNVFTSRQLLAKRILDLCGALVGMIILGLSYIFVAPMIKLDSPGPVIFGQIRVGKNGRKFTIYKYRSMYIDAEKRKKELMEKNEIEGLMFKMENDPRITKVGKFLRKTSIDELPQFYNILKGDMSLVGTRPPTVDEYEQYETNHKCRLSMKPGLTGMWQVSGRSDIKNFEDVVALDMQYIDNWSIFKDIKILIQTIGVLLRTGL